MGPFDMKAYNFYDGKWLEFEFESGVHVQGLNVTGIRNIHGKLMLIRLKDCTVTYNSEVLFRPEYGMFDMAVGSTVLSAYAGSADYNSFPNLYGVSEVRTVKKLSTESDKRLNSLYAEVSFARESGNVSLDEFKRIAEEVKMEFEDEWLLLLEIYEISTTAELRGLLKGMLEEVKERRPNLKLLIDEGVKLADFKV